MCLIKLLKELLSGKVKPLTYEERWKNIYFSKEDN